MVGASATAEGHGAAVRRVEDGALLRGARPFTDDLRNPDAGSAVFVRAGVAHATIAGIDALAAAASPGVVGVYTADDLELEPFGPGDPLLAVPEAMHRPVLAKDRVRFIGEPVAVVVAETRGQTVDAAGLVAVEYDYLDVLVDMTKALEKDAPLLFPDAPNGNLAATSRSAHAPREDVLAGAEVRVGARLVN